MNFGKKFFFNFLLIIIVDFKLFLNSESSEYPNDIQTFFFYQHTENKKENTLNVPCLNLIIHEQNMHGCYQLPRISLIGDLKGIVKRRAQHTRVTITVNRSPMILSAKSQCQQMRPDPLLSAQPPLKRWLNIFD